MLLELVVYLVFGKVIIFFIQLWVSDNVPEEFTIRYKWLDKLAKFIVRLLSCDLCLGFWVYAVLSGIFNIYYEKISILTYIPVLTEVMNGMIFSFLVHLVSLGWNSKFQQFVIK